MAKLPDAEAPASAAEPAAPKAEPELGRSWRSGERHEQSGGGRGERAATHLQNGSGLGTPKTNNAGKETTHGRAS
jgi:hypothetical protein